MPSIPHLFSTSDVVKNYSPSESIVSVAYNSIRSLEKNGLNLEMPKDWGWSKIKVQKAIKKYGLNFRKSSTARSNLKYGLIISDATVV